MRIQRSAAVTKPDTGRSGCRGLGAGRTEWARSSAAYRSGRGSADTGRLAPLTRAQRPVGWFGGGSQGRGAQSTICR